MKILGLTRYDRLGASSRLRFIQYLPQFKLRGIEVSFSPLFGDEYLRTLQKGERHFSSIISGYVRRFSILLRSKEYDLIWIEKECLPWLPYGLEGLLLSGEVPYVLDYDDAVFHYYDQHRMMFVRQLLGHKHRKLMEGAAMVMVGNQYLGDYARKSAAKRIEYLPTVVDLQRYQEPFSGIASDNHSVPCIGWMGQRSTAEFLRSLVPMLKGLVDQRKARFTAIGIDQNFLGCDSLFSLPWREDTEVSELRKFDIGIMPLSDGAFERGKCGYKIIQYMSCGLPVVASPVGVNRQLIEDGVNGFLADTLDEWSAAILRLIEDPSLRIRMGQAGLEKVRAQYCVQVTGPRFIDLLTEVQANLM